MLLAGAVLLAVLLACESSRAMLASARFSYLYFVHRNVDGLGLTASGSESYHMNESLDVTCGHGVTRAWTLDSDTHRAATL